MIARSWDGFTKAEDATVYAEYIRRTGARDLAETPGNHAVYVLRRREGGRAHFRVLSLWDSMEAVRRFAGEDPERARYYPEDARFLEELLPHVEHFEILVPAEPATGEAAALARELDTLVRGNNWHGPTLSELLEGLSAEDAAARAVPGAHTIWELVLHVTGWTDVFRRRLEGVALEEPEAGDYPAPPPPSAKAWREATERLIAAQDALTAHVAALDEAGLRRPVPGRPFDARFQVAAAIRHTVYHSGQIGLLKRAVRG
jgi:heme-degrading monooxygenase HmoA/uncharacterized damage-inducible protein DinB